MKYTQHLMGNIQLDLVQITQFFDQNTYIIARNYKQVNIVAAIILKNFIKRFATVGRKPQFQGCQIYIRLWTGQDLQLAKLIDCYRE
ncbi:hypothetical protein SS50377_24852 [Spironucleus salmonicida]|uniref:Uncharacterized protein n=1 Tax=Spironucleus salmonicida TaxID=348837 RepID=V6LWU0_9EUKA|nr:hypothetical protein SS50377_24852 [Spironucleus salmonicida]|eukprot:EST49117.1 Hypothetical protein SS50377_10602 [Spironucleus salmonicida]